MDKMYHIGLTKEDIEGAKYAILPGDPGRVSEIAKYLQNSKKLNINREYTSYLGKVNGESVLVVSTGIGGPSMAIAVEELSTLGVSNFIRIGTSGGMQVDVDPGDLVIASSAVRAEGTTRQYAPLEYPAVSDFSLTMNLKKSAERLGYKNHVGVVHSKDSFFGQHAPERMPVSYELINSWNAYVKAGALVSEMETAALFVVSSYLKVKSASILLVLWNQEQEKAGIRKKKNFEIDRPIKVVIDALNEMIKQGSE